MKSSAVSSPVIVGAVILVVVVAAGGLYLFLGSGPSSSTTSSTTSSVRSSTTSTTTSQSVSTSLVVPPVNSAFTQYVNNFNNRDVERVVAFYTPDAVVTWTGNTGGTSGTYQGTNSIRLAMSTSVGHTTSFNVIATNVTQSSTSPTAVTLAYTFNMTGVSTIIGPFNATIFLTQNWIYNNGQWSVQKDLWNYLSFASANSGEATVFPQWGLSLSGKSPNLAQEHVLEWNLAPFLAAAVYTSVLTLGIILVLGMARNRRHQRQRSD